MTTKCWCCGAPAGGETCIDETPVCFDCVMSNTVLMDPECFCRPALEFLGRNEFLAAIRWLKPNGPSYENFTDDDDEPYCELQSGGLYCDCAASDASDNLWGCMNETCYCCGAPADTRTCVPYLFVTPLCVACALSNPGALCSGCLDTAMRRCMDATVEITSTFAAALPFGPSYEGPGSVTIATDGSGLRLVVRQ